MLPEPTVVGIGASAGGLAALKTFFAHVSEGSGLAFVVVVHLSPEHAFHISKKDMRVLLFHIVRELLFNVVKHAETDRAIVTLREADATGHLVDVSLPEMNGIGLVREVLSRWPERTAEWRIPSDKQQPVLYIRERRSTMAGSSWPTARSQ